MVATTARVTHPFLHNHKGLRLYYLLVLFTHSCEAFPALLGVTKMRDILFKGADWLKIVSIILPMNKPGSQLITVIKALTN